MNANTKNAVTNFAVGIMLAFVFAGLGNVFG